MDYPLGEKKERESPLHYHVIDFLLNLANEPIKAAELQDPIKKDEIIESDNEQFVDSEEDQIFDPSQWQDDDTLSGKVIDGFEISCKGFLRNTSFSKSISDGTFRGQK